MGFVWSAAGVGVDGVEAGGMDEGEEASGFTAEGKVGADAAYDRRKVDSARGSGVRIGMIGVGRGRDDPEDVFSFRRAPEKALIPRAWWSCGPISRGEAILDSCGTGSLAWSEIIGAG